MKGQAKKSALVERSRSEGAQGNQPVAHIQGDRLGATVHVYRPHDSVLVGDHQTVVVTGEGRTPGGSGQTVGDRLQGQRCPPILYRVG